MKKKRKKKKKTKNNLHIMCGFYSGTTRYTWTVQITFEINVSNLTQCCKRFATASTST